MKTDRCFAIQSVRSVAFYKLNYDTVAAALVQKKRAVMSLSCPRQTPLPLPPILPYLESCSIKMFTMKWNSYKVLEDAGDYNYCCYQHCT